MRFLLLCPPLFCIMSLVEHVCISNSLLFVHRMIYVNSVMSVHFDNMCEKVSNIVITMLLQPVMYISLIQKDSPLLVTIEHCYC